MALSVDQARIKGLLSRKPVHYSVGGAVALFGAMGTVLLAPSHTQPQVLAASRELPPGTVLTRADLSWVDSAMPGSGAVPAGQEDAYLGKTLSFGLPAGALLAPGDVGRFPPAGYMKVSLLLKPGQYPQDLTPGQKVGILPLAADGSDALAAQQSGTASGVIPGELLALSPAGAAQDGMVAELLVASSQAPQVAAAPSAALLGGDGAGL